MKICIGADHRGFALKAALINHFGNYQWRDVGAHSAETSDYPLYTKKVCRDILSGDAQYGIMVCGSGVGPSIVANRFRGIYAALAWDIEIAQSSKEKINANMLILPADHISENLAFELVRTWMSATFQGGRYQQRLEMIDQE
jgi:ribose 5-phosphate isomerase B